MRRSTCGIAALAVTLLSGCGDRIDVAEPPTDACAGIEPPHDVPMEQYVRRFGDHCLPGVGDARGTLAFPVSLNLSTSHGATVDFVTSRSVFLREHFLGELDPNLLPQPDGFAAATGPGYLGPRNWLNLPRWDSAGNELAGGYRFGEDVARAGDRSGGVLVAGDFATDAEGPTEHVAQMFTGGATPFGVRWGPTALASTGAVLGAGVDLLGRSLVITNGALKYGAGTLSGQWFDRDGTPLTGEFMLVSNFTPGQAWMTWMEAPPLIDGGLLVRRMDWDADGHHAQALVVVASGSDVLSTPPEWMTSRRNVRLEIARGGRAYAALPYPETNVACTQRVEVIAPDGTVCGARDYPIANGTCSTGDVTLGMDGTVIQQLPQSMETDEVADTSGHTCTWRWWPGALR